VYRSVVVLSPTCAKSNTVVSPIRASHKEQNNPLNTNNKHYLAEEVASPAGDPAAARQCTGMILQTKRQNTMTPHQNILTTHFTQTKASGHIKIRKKYAHQHQPRSFTTISDETLINTSYLAQCNHSDAASQTSNRRGRVSLGRGTVANLREIKHSRQPDTRTQRAKQPPQHKQQASLGCSCWIPSRRPRRCSTAHRNSPANKSSKRNDTASK
jgi:hypothetical protein